IDYWAEEAVTKWNVIDYFMKLVEEDHIVDKKIALANITKDLQLMQTALIHLPDVKTKTNTMMDQINKKKYTHFLVLGQALLQLKNLIS
ncbi:hypothetical protein EDC94DRAFT_518433, partial [Helicostylum pulchrum]